MSRRRRVGGAAIAAEAGVSRGAAAPQPQGAERAGGRACRSARPLVLPPGLPLFIGLCRGGDAASPSRRGAEVREINAHRSGLGSDTNPP